MNVLTVTVNIFTVNINCKREFDCEFSNRKKNIIAKTIIAVLRQFDIYLHCVSDFLIHRDQYHFYLSIFWFQKHGETPKKRPKRRKKKIRIHLLLRPLTVNPILLLTLGVVATTRDQIKSRASILQERITASVQLPRRRPRPWVAIYWFDHRLDRREIRKRSPWRLSFRINADHRSRRRCRRGRGRAIGSCQTSLSPCWPSEDCTGSRPLSSWQSGVFPTCPGVTRLTVS